jgi:hypothetical protein
MSGARAPKGPAGVATHVTGDTWAFHFIDESGAMPQCREVEVHRLEIQLVNV